MFSHRYPFDPTYGKTLEALLRILPPREPVDFSSFWQSRLARALQVDPTPVLLESRQAHPKFDVKDIEYRSTDGFRIGGWLLKPKLGEVKRAVVVGHGYGGRDRPDYHLPIEEAALLFPCFRGLSRSRRADVSDNPVFHVLHDIDKADRYILGGCVDDLWIGVTVLQQLFPATIGHIGYLGISFGGGIGAMALSWDERIRRGHLNIPSFGHQSLRLNLPTVGSGDAVTQFDRKYGHVMETLQYYDAALAARHCKVPVHVAAALFDPVVAPPGQFAVYNALACPKELFVLFAGHFDYPGQPEQETRLLVNLQRFFNFL
ncbi:MAG: acetylxylan esterase [Methylococcaceae bacterium]|nr:acetylxylan esterase [Methylococcaceae bacterium]